MRFRLADGGSSRRAGVMPLAALSFALLVSVVALVVDGGTLMEDRRHVQAAADAAALAGAADVFYNYITNQGADPGGTAQTSALDTAAANGFNNDGVSSVVTVSIFPQNYQAGPNAGKPLPPGYVEVIVQHNASRLFSGVFGTAAIPVRARAVARGRWGPGSDAIMLLNLQASGALNSTSSSNLIINGGLAVNSSSPTALRLSSGAVLASQFNLNKASGSLSGPVLSLLSGLGGTSPTINYGAPMPDPLRYLPDPDPVALGLALQGTNLHISSGIRNLHPGIYFGGITASGGAVAILHANSNGTPGIYFLQGGGLTVSGPSIVMTAPGETAGVMIYNDWKSSSDAITLSGSGALIIHPPAFGLYQGMSIFQKRGTVNSAAPPITISGSGAMNLTGTVYAPYANVTLSGSAGVDVLGGQIIADTMTLTGKAAISINRGSDPIANTRMLGLVE
jgi:Flp pilus assembly protein TadG